MPLDEGSGHGGGGGGDDSHNEQVMSEVIDAVLKTLELNCDLNKVCHVCTGASLMLNMFERLLEHDLLAAESVLTAFKASALEIKHKRKAS